jgi:hypothetical protein
MDDAPALATVRPVAPSLANGPHLFKGYETMSA